MSRILVDLVPEFQMLRVSERFILYRLADYASDKGICWPGIKRLCFETGLDKTTVYSAINVLEGMGILKKETNVGRGTTYYLTFDEALTNGVKPIQRNNSGRGIRSSNVEGSNGIYEDAGEVELSESDDFILGANDTYADFVNRLKVKGYDINDIRIKKEYLVQRRERDRANGRKV